MEKIKILHLIESLAMGGAERRLINDLKFMDNNRFSNTVCCVKKDSGLGKEVKSLGVKVFFLEEHATGHAGKLLYLLKYLIKNKIDILHSQIFWADIYGRIAGKISGVKHVVSTIQGTPYSHGVPFLNSSKRKFLDGFTGRCFGSGFIAVSEYAKKSAVQNLRVNKELIEVVYNYIDFQCWQEVNKAAVDRFKKELRIAEEGFVLITVGRLDPPKGHRYVLEALPSIIEEEQNIKYLIIGDGPYRETLQSLTKELNIEQNVVFTGNRMDVKELIYLSDIFIFPSLSEGLSVALMEAMASGKPCIATSIPPNLEIIEDRLNGLTVPPEDSKSIKNAILFLMRSKTVREKISIEGQRTIKEKFSPKHNIKLLEEYYLKACN